MSSKPPMDLLRELADLYPTQSSTVALWERAGGSAREVAELSRPVDRWQAVWGHSARGASVTPAALLRAAWEDQPNNTRLLKALVAELPHHADPELVRAAERLVARLADQAQDGVGVIELLAEWEERDPARTFAAICPAVERGLVPERRAALKERLRAPVAQGLVNGMVQAGVGQAVKVALDTLNVMI